MPVMHPGPGCSRLGAGRVTGKRQEKGRPSSPYRDYKFHFRHQRAAEDAVSSSREAGSCKAKVSGSVNPELSQDMEVWRHRAPLLTSAQIRAIQVAPPCTYFSCKNQVSGSVLP